MQDFHSLILLQTKGQGTSRFVSTRAVYWPYDKISITTQRSWLKMEGHCGKCMFISVLCSSAHPNSHTQSPDSDGEFVFDLHNCTHKSLPASELSKKLISHANSLILFPLCPVKFLLKCPMTTFALVTLLHTWKCLKLLEGASLISEVNCKREHSFITQ